jgi:hypothetical protein
MEEVGVVEETRKDALVVREERRKEGSITSLVLGSTFPTIAA